MNQTTTDLLREIAQTGQAVIVHSRLRDLNAASDLISAGICYKASTHVGYTIIKFGTQPVTI